MKQRAGLCRMFIFARVSRLNDLDPMDAVDAELYLSLVWIEEAVVEDAPVPCIW